MKKISALICFVLVLLLSSSLETSGQEARSVTVKAGESITDVLPFNEIYLYPQFTKGIAVKSDGVVTEGFFNYNIIIGEMQFIGTRKDTLAVAHPEYVRYFVVNADTFYFNKVYFRRISGNNGFMLAAHQFASLADVRTAGPYGTTSSTSTVDSYSSLYSQDNAKVYKLKVNVETIYSIRCDYFFTGPDKEFVLARKNFLLKMFPGKSDKIKQFIKDNSIRFNNREDLVKLTGFVGSLP